MGRDTTPKAWRAWIRFWGKYAGPIDAGFARAAFWAGYQAAAVHASSRKGGQ